MKILTIIADNRVALLPKWQQYMINELMLSGLEINLLIISPLANKKKKRWIDYIYRFESSYLSSMNIKNK